MSCLLSYDMRTSILSSAFHSAKCMYVVKYRSLNVSRSRRPFHSHEDKVIIVRQSECLLFICIPRSSQDLHSIILKFYRHGGHLYSSNSGFERIQDIATVQCRNQAETQSYIISMSWGCQCKKHMHRHPRTSLRFYRLVLLIRLRTYLFAVLRHERRQYGYVHRNVLVKM